jgi:hypothetical protein
MYLLHMQVVLHFRPHLDAPNVSTIELLAETLWVSFPPVHSGDHTIKGLFGWAVAVKKVVVGCELWKNLL